MLRELLEYSNNTREEMKVTLSEMKIYREPTVEKITPRINSMQGRKMH